MLNCEPFALLPNCTKKIDIAFTPDFTLAKITRTLVLDTSMGVPVNYTLVTTVPAGYLALCSNALSRPQWEIYLYYTAISVMVFLLSFVVIIPIMESQRVLKQTLGAMSRQPPSAQLTLDLRLVGAQTRSEIRSHKPEVPETKNSTEICKSGYRSSAEDVKAKMDVEKYSALLLPASGEKVKRKVVKRKSGYVQKSQKKPAKPVETVKKTSSKDVSKGNCPLQVKDEEETSSTTTESSNTDDMDIKCKAAPPRPEWSEKSPSLMKVEVAVKKVAVVKSEPKINISKERPDAVVSVKDVASTSSKAVTDPGGWLKLLL